MDLKFESSRVGGQGYLEFVYIQGTKDRQPIAMITDVCHPKAFGACYGTWTCQGDTVAEVKERLFRQIEKTSTPASNEPH